MNTILVIDDDYDYRSGIMEILKFENYTAIGAENGQIGLDMIRQHLPNLIICDIDMPVMNGIEVLKTVKADPVFAKIPFLIVSGGMRKLTGHISHEPAAGICFTKPLNMPEFLSTIGTFLSVEAPV
jgi:CheY-like chemotaxis protein